MNKNVGTIDRSVRALAGLVIIGIGVVFQSWWGAIGLLPLATAAIGWCPPYAMLGLSTCKVKEQEQIKS
jgi:hypothetical protein